jgi:hypothetical protein
LNELVSIHFELGSNCFYLFRGTSGLCVLSDGEVIFAVGRHGGGTQESISRNQLSLRKVAVWPLQLMKEGNRKPGFRVEALLGQKRRESGATVHLGLRRWAFGAVRWSQVGERGI